VVVAADVVSDDPAGAEVEDTVSRPPAVVSVESPEEHAVTPNITIPTIPTSPQRKRCECIIRLG
jgi:hypothetical protein